MLGFHTAWPDPSFFLFSLKSLFSSHLSLSFFIQHRALTLSPSCCCVFHPFVYFLQMFLSYLNLNPLLFIFSLASILYLTLLSFISVVRRLHCYESYICQSLTSLSLCCSPVTTKIRLQVIVSTWRDQLPLIAFGGRVTFDRVARERGNAMEKLWLCCKLMVTEWAQLITIWNALKSLFSSKHSLQHFQVLDKLISLEMFYKGGTLFRLLLIHAGRIKYLVCPHAFWKACLEAT